MKKVKGPPRQIEDFSVLQRQGRHFTTLSEESNMLFLKHCIRDRRDPADLLRIVVDEYYEKLTQETRNNLSITSLPAAGSSFPRFGPKPEGHRGHTPERSEDQGQNQQ